MIDVKSTRTKAGDCSFAVAAASLRNILPIYQTSTEDICFVLLISVIRHEHYYYFTSLFGNIINT